MWQHPARLAAALLALAAGGCVTTTDRPVPPAPAAPSPAAPPIAAPATLPVETASPAAPLTSGEGLQAVDLSAPTDVVRVEAEVPRYAPPESLKKFRYAKPPVEKPVANAAASKALEPAAMHTVRPTAASGVPTPARPLETETQATELPRIAVATVTAQPEAPRYKLPDSLGHWGSGRKVPLYADPDAAPWQADAAEPRLQNAAVSCNYKDEGGVRGKAMLLVDNNKLTRFTARIEMPNGGICQFDSKKMAQRPFEQGIALQSKDDECIVRMWEQKHRITIAAYSCHKQCSRGSFSYLWPIIMDTRVGTCY